MTATTARKIVVRPWCPPGQVSCRDGACAPVCAESLSPETAVEAQETEENTAPMVCVHHAHAASFSECKHGCSRAYVAVNAPSQGQQLLPAYHTGWASHAV